MDNNYLQQSRKKPFWSYLFFVFGVLLLIFILSATFFGLVFLQSVDENLDLRKQALVASKRVDFNTYPFNQSFFKAKELNHIEIQINTYNHVVDALELHFYIKTDKNLWREQDLKITGINQEQLKLVQAEIQQVDCDVQHDCFLATLLLISADPNIPFTSRNLSSSIARLEFFPQKEGAISMQLNQTSQVNEHGTGQNILENQNLAEFTYYVSNNGIDFAQCSYLYSEWSECENFWQTRQYQVAPLNCHWYQEETLQTLSRQCSEKTADNVSLASEQNLFLHYFRSCLNTSDQGEKFYLMWNNQLYPGFDRLDVSLDHYFTNFYQKPTTNAQTTDNYSIINLANLSGFTQSLQGKTLTFQADQEYYFRLYNSQTGKFIVGPQLYLNYCASDLSQRSDCQEACNPSEQESNCLEGLSCIDGYCSLPNNPENQWCFDPNLISAQNQTNGLVAGLSTQISDSTIINQGPFLPSEIYDLETYACNHGCNTNRDCMADYRCYQGRCRLASNPTSPSCEAKSIVTQPIENTEEEVFLDTEQEPTETPTITTTETKESAIEQKESTIEATADGEIKNEDKKIETNIAPILTSLSTTLTALFNSFNWQYLALAGLLIIIAIVFIILGLNKDPQQVLKKKDKEIKPLSENPSEIKQKEVIIPENKKIDL